MKKEEYLRCVTDQIRCKKACPGIEKELEDHITDQAEMYLKKGMTEEQALKKAIAEMGDPVQVGVELDRIHRPQMSWGLVLLAGILGIISIVLQYGLKSHGYEMGFPQRQLLFTVVGFDVGHLLSGLQYTWKIWKMDGRGLSCIDGAYHSMPTVYGRSGNVSPARKYGSVCTTADVPLCSFVRSSIIFL